MLRSTSNLALTLAVCLVASTALAEQTVSLPSAVELLPITESSYPFNGAAHQVEPIDLPSYNFIEEEFLISGQAGIYDWMPDGDFAVSLLGDAPYTTRIMVRRPVDMADFSGRVVMEVINMSADYDWTAMWAALWQRVVANGDVYIGLTAKPNVFPGLKAFDSDRYSALDMPSADLAGDADCTLPEDDIHYANLSSETESGLAWDMFSQLGALLKSESDLNPLGVPAERVFFTGESQSGNYGITYYKFFQPDAVITRNGKSEPIYDGFLLEAATTPAGAPIRQCAVPLAEDDPQIQIPGRAAPLAMINSQWDFFPEGGGERKADSNTSDDRSVTWELTGSHHGWRFQYLYGDADHDDLDKAGLLVGDWSAWTCAPESPEVPLYMAEKALYEHLIDWVETGTAPPSADPIELTEGGDVAFDEVNTARGGLRLPMIEVPVASYGEGLAVLSEGCPEIVPFGADQLVELYGSRENYLDAYHRATWRLVQQGFLLAEDMPELLEIAKAVPFR